jgi:hypothetical protein
MENIKVWAALVISSSFFFLIKFIFILFRHHIYFRFEFSRALKLRYLIKGEILLPKTKPTDQITPPNSQPQDPTSPPNPTIIAAANTNTNNSNSSHDSGSILKFDPKMIAKKSDGWDLALVYMVSKWLDSIKAEKREEVLFSK